MVLKTLQIQRFYKMGHRDDSMSLQTGSYRGYANSKGIDLVDIGIENSKA